MCCFCYYRSVFIVIVIQNLEGERDYGQQAFATFTCLRSHFGRGVVHIVLVRVKVYDVRSSFLVLRTSQQLFIFSPEAHIMYFIVWWRLASYFLKSAFGVDQTMKCKCRGFMATRKCVCGEHINHISCFLTFRGFQIRYAHQGLSDICILSGQNRSTFISIYDTNMIATAELERHYL